MLAANQREQELKFELLVQIAGDEPTAVASFNYHQDHFALEVRARRSPTAAPRTPPASASARSGSCSRCCAPTASIPSRWPAAVRGELWGDADDGTSATLPRSLFGSIPPATSRIRSTASGRTYVETNCYTDVIIELLHARGDEPLAALGCLVRTDFEGDQWTFFKPPPEDLERCSESTSTRCSRTARCRCRSRSRSSSGRTIIVELDSWYLPDTAATSYRSEHVKTSVAAEAIDLERGWLRYFHGPGLFELEGDDYRGVFRLDGELLRRGSCRPTPSSSASTLASA